MIPFEMGETVIWSNCSKMPKVLNIPFKKPVKTLNMSYFVAFQVVHTFCFDQTDHKMLPCTQQLRQSKEILFHPSGALVLG